MDYSMISEFLFFTNLINDYTNSINTSCSVLIFSERSLHTILKDILSKNTLCPSFFVVACFWSVILTLKCHTTAIYGPFL